MEHGCHTGLTYDPTIMPHITTSRVHAAAGCSKVTGIPRNTVLRVFDQTMASSLRGTVYRKYRQTRNLSLTAGEKVPISDCKLAVGEGGDPVVLDGKLAEQREKSEV